MRSRAGFRWMFLVPWLAGAWLTAGVACAGYGQARRFTALSVEDGLPQSSVYSLCRDSAGFLWVGTADGLARYDGYSFRTWRPHPGQAGTLPHATVRSIMTGRDGLIWLGTDGGVAAYDPARDVFRVLPGLPVGPGMAQQVIGAAGAGLWLLSPYGELLRYGSGSSRVVQRGVARAVAGPDNIRVVDSAGGVWVVPREDERPRRLAGGPGGRQPLGVANCLLVGGKTWWLGTSSGLWQRDIGGAGSWQAVEGPRGWQADRDVMALAAAPDGRLWVGTQARGLWRYDPTTETWQQDAGGPTRTVGALVADPAGSLWIGTDGAGLLRTGLTSPPFGGHGAGAGSLPPLPDPFVTALLLDHAGRVWVGTLGHGITLVDRERGRVGPLPVRGAGAGRMADCTVRGLWQDSTRRVWMATSAGLMSWQDGQLRIHEQEGSRPGDRQRALTSLLVTRDRRMLLPGRGGVFELQPAGQLRPALATRWMGLIFFTAYEARRGRIWLGSYGSGAYWLARGERQLHPLRVKGPDSASLHHAMARCFHEDARGRVWVGTDQGLFVVEPATGQYRVLREAEGLPAACVFSLVADQAGQLWVGTSRGLARLDPVTGRVRAYGLADGLQSLEFNTNATWLSGSGELLLGGTNGYNWCWPALLQPSGQVPRPALLELRLNGSLLPDSAYRPRLSLALSFQQNELGFTFAGLGLTDPARAAYRYRLQGADAHWVEAGASRQARYVGLRPGAYAFEVRAANADGVWSAPATLLRFVISPPWWQRPGIVIAGVVVVLGALAWLVRHLATRQLRAQVRALERQRQLAEERGRIAQDMHDDLGAGLSRLLLLGEVARRVAADDAGVLRQHLDTTTAATRELLERVGHIVWALNPEHDHFGGFVAYLREYAGELLDAAGISVTFELPAPGDPHVPVVADRLRRNLFLLVKEALHNVVKHAGAGRVWLTLRVEGQILTLMLRDDGRGFDPTQTRRFGQGLKSLYRRAADSGGELVLETAPGQGTLLTVRVPVAPATGADGNRRRRWWHGAGSRLIIPAVGWRRRS